MTTESRTATIYYVDAKTLVDALHSAGASLRDAERFAEKVDFQNAHWMWTAGTNQTGHGVFGVKKDGAWTTESAHRFIYRHLVNSKIDHLDIDHLCRTSGCVKPTHLEAVQHDKNLQRGVFKKATKTHCKNGHEFTDENTYWAKNQRNGRKYRQCRECTRIRSRRYKRSRD